MIPKKREKTCRLSDISRPQWLQGGQLSQRTRTLRKGPPLQCPVHTTSPQTFPIAPHKNLDHQLVIVSGSLSLCAKY
jgi:hypothetical protein